MGSRLLPLTLALAALLGDALGLHRVAFYVVLLAVVGAAAAAFVGVGDLLGGTGSLLRAASTAVALVLLVVGSAVRAEAAVGARLPTLAISTIVLAAIAYAVPLVAWLFEPLAPRQRPARALLASRSR
jgi:hypothetical protein